MNSRKKFIFPSVVTALFLLTGCAAEQTSVADENQELVFESHKLPIATSPSEVGLTASATLSAVGDILIHERVYKDALTEEGYDFNPMLETVKPFMEQADITVANSESIIGGSEIGLSTYPAFNSPYEVGDALKQAGVDVVTLANNHTLDRGVPAIENAVRYWDQIGMVHAGSYFIR